MNINSNNLPNLDSKIILKKNTLINKSLNKNERKKVKNYTTIKHEIDDKLINNNSTKIRKPIFFPMLKKISNIKDYQIKIYNNVHDIKTTLLKNKLNPKSKIFIISPGYSIIKKELLNYGWKENPNFESSIFHLKFTLSGRDINFDMVEDFQYINHFQNSNHITTKIGLYNSLKCSSWINNIIEDFYFPKCFDTNEKNSLNNFINYFKIVKCESILKRMIYNKDNINIIKHYYLKAIICYDILKINLKNNFNYIVKDNEWNIINKKISEFDSLKEVVIDFFERKINYLEKKNNIIETKMNKYKLYLNSIKNIENDNLIQNNLMLIINKANKIIQKLLKCNNQLFMNGSKNIWILKPSSLSRGRGIKLFSNLEKILNYINAKESAFIIQKYIERPLKINNKKFDIRQIVLVTGINPLRIFLYEDCYARLSTIEYKNNNINNIKQHLTNNCLQKRGITADININDTTIISSNFDDIFGTTYKTIIEPQIINIIKWSILCGKEYIKERKRSNEIFGFDLMIDESFKVWLIEINSSPSFDMSTDALKSIITGISKDYVKVIVEGLMKKSGRKKEQFGKFKLIYKSKLVKKGNDQYLNNFKIESEKIINLKNII